jgi:hypothetical protein
MAAPMTPKPMIPTVFTSFIFFLLNDQYEIPTRFASTRFRTISVGRPYCQDREMG